MKSAQVQAAPAPPSLMGSLKAGFDATANHIELLLIPIVVDLMLWFGPHLRLDQLIDRVFTDLRNQPGLNAADMVNLVEITGEFWSLLAERLNLFSALRSYPVGMPSLMVASQPIDTPIGSPLNWQIGSFSNAILVWIVLTLAGLVIGTFYFTLVSQVVISKKISIRLVLENLPGRALQVILLAILLTAFLFVLSIPFSCLVSAVIFSGIPFGQASLLFFGVIALWILLPFFFSPHGIFVNRSSMLISVRDSLRVVRVTMPKTALFFLILLGIDEGMTMLWRIPKENSWLALVGVVGHAFITTGLIAASFVYYLDARRWLQRLVQQTQLSSAI